MMKILLAVLIGLGIAQSSWGQEPPEPHPILFHAAIAAGMALQGADAMQTAYLLGSRQGQEMNPVLAPLSDYPAWFGATKLGLAAGISWAIIHLHSRPKGRWAAVGLLVGELVLESYAIAHNNRLLPSRRHP